MSSMRITHSAAVAARACVRGFAIIIIRVYYYDHLSLNIKINKILCAPLNVEPKANATAAAPDNNIIVVSLYRRYIFI